VEWLVRSLRVYPIFILHQVVRTAIAAFSLIRFGSIASPYVLIPLAASESYFLASEIYACRFGGRIVSSLLMGLRGMPKILCLILPAAATVSLFGLKALIPISLLALFLTFYPFIAILKGYGVVYSFRTSLKISAKNFGLVLKMWGVAGLILLPYSLILKKIPGPATLALNFTAFPFICSCLLLWWTDCYLKYVA